MRSLNLLVAAFALLQCVRYARGALLCLWPAVRIWGEAGQAPGSPARLRAGAALESLGFAPLGTVHERGPLGALARESDSYASAERGVFADVTEERTGDGPRVQFFTPFGSGAAVLTAGHRRPAVITARTQAGGMPGAPLAAVLAAHEKGVARFTRDHGRPAVREELDSRLAAARAWYQGEGRRELRRANALALLIAAFGLALFASSAHILLRGAAGG
jgi:hypothetical protein